MRILVVDDHPLIREALASVLHRLGAAVEVDTAADCAQGFERAAQGAEPDLLLLDLALPGLSGLAALEAWRARCPSLPVIVLSAGQDRATMLAVLAAGAAGFVPKSASNEVMLGAIRLVLEGGRYLPPELLEAAAPAPAGAPEPALTPRQRDVLRLVARGVPNKLICRELGLAERTVKTHVTAVLRALNVASRTQAALAAARLGLDRDP